MKTITINLEELIRTKTDLSEICKGRISTYIMQDERNYCTLAKGGLGITCSSLFIKDYKHHNVCLYTVDKMSEPLLMIKK